MAIDNNITHDSFMQSLTFKNIVHTGTKMAAFLHGVSFSSDKQKQTATELKRSWRNACEHFAKKEDDGWDIIRHGEIIEDVNEYLTKANALIEMALEAKLSNLSPDVLHGYFGDLSSLINVAISVFKDLE